MLEDSALLHRFARAADQAAFAELVTRHIDRVYGVALRQVGGDTHLAEDVAQIVFTTLARKAASLIDHPALSAWIHRATHHAAVDAVRSEARRRAREEKAHAMHELHDDPRRDAAWDTLRPDLDAVLAALPERDRAALALRFFEDRPFADIGQRLRVSEDAARMRVDRALDKTRGLLARRGITCTAAALGGALAAPSLLAAPNGLAASISTNALVASAGAAAGAGTLVSFMSSTKIVTSIAAAIVVLAAGTATYDTVTHAPGAETTIATSTDTPTAEEHRAIEARTAAVVAETEAIRAELASLRATRAQAAARLVVPQRSTNAEAEELGRIFMERHPEVRQAFHDWKDATTRLDYSALFRQLKLTPEQIDQLLALKRAGGTMSGTWGPNDTQMILRAEGTAATGDLEAVLGENGFKVYREYERSKMERRASMRAASYLSFSDEPLSAEQTDELTRILQQNRLKQRPGEGTERYDWDKVMAEASGILTESQRPVLEALRADDRYSAAVNRSVP